MSSDDGGLRDLIRKHLGGTRFVVGTVEMGFQGSGWPDINYAFPGGEGWCECKRVDGWKLNKNNIKPAQIGWLKERAILGCRVWVAVRRAMATTDEFWLLPGALHGDFCREGLRAPCVEEQIAYKGEGGPRHWDWEAIRTILTGPAPGSFVTQG